MSYRSSLSSSRRHDDHHRGGMEYQGGGGDVGGHHHDHYRSSNGNNNKRSSSRGGEFENDARGGRGYDTSGGGDDKRQRRDESGHYNGRGSSRGSREDGHREYYNRDQNHRGEQRSEGLSDEKRPGCDADGRWKCLECEVWNYRARCYRCGKGNPAPPQQEHQDWDRSDRQRQEDRDRDGGHRRRSDSFRDVGDRDRDHYDDRRRHPGDRRHHYGDERRHSSDHDYGYGRDRDRDYERDGHDRRHPRHPRSRSYGRGDDEEDEHRRQRGESCGAEELDEFGRPKRASENKSLGSSKSKSKKGKEKGKEQREWPPCFTTNGSSFVFDARSAMFYEAESDFFYDPKSKLYYGNKKGAYFRYDDTKDPPKFVEVSKNAGGDNDATKTSSGINLDPLMNDVAGGNNNKAEEKPMIAINLKSKITTKTRKRSASSAGDKNKSSSKMKDKKDATTTDDHGNGKKEAVTTSTTTTASSMTVKSRVQKQHAANMEKWVERGKEIKATIANEQQEQQVLLSLKKIVKTVKGEPVCLLCKRKFINIEKLMYHEKKSKLHQYNLTKQKKKQQVLEKGSAANNSNSMEYLDRAQQRRALYGVEASSSAVLPPLPTQNQEQRLVPIQTAADVVTPKDTLGSNNVGNQMLQKLGWKAGSSLGRATANTDAASGNGGNNDNKNNLQDAIVKDWERIESIAGN